MIFGERFYPMLQKMPPWRHSLYALVLATKAYPNFALWCDINKAGGKSEYLQALKQCWNYHYDKYNHIDLEKAYDLIEPFMPLELDEYTEGDSFAFDAAVMIDVALESVPLNSKNAKNASMASMSSVIRFCEHQFPEQSDEEDKLLELEPIQAEIDFQIALMEKVMLPRSSEVVRELLEMALAGSCSNIGIESDLTIDDFKECLVESEAEFPNQDQEALNPWGHAAGTEGYVEPTEDDEEDVSYDPEKMYEEAGLEPNEHDFALESEDDDTDFSELAAVLDKNSKANQPENKNAIEDIKAPADPHLVLITPANANLDKRDLDPKYQDRIHDFDDDGEEYEVGEEHEVKLHDAHGEPVLIDDDDILAMIAAADAEDEPHKKDGSHEKGAKKAHGDKHHDKKHADKRRDNERRERGSRSFGRDRDDRSERKFGDRPPRKDHGEHGDRKFGERKFGDRTSRGDREDRKFGERSDRKFGERKFGDRPSRGDREDRKFGERSDRKFGDRKFGDRPPRGDREDRGFGERSERKFGERKFGDKKFGDRKFGDKKFGDRPPRGDREDRGFGERSERKFGERKFGDKKFGDRPPRKDHGDRKFGDKKFEPKRTPRVFGPYSHND